VRVNCVGETRLRRKRDWRRVFNINCSMCGIAAPGIIRSPTAAANYQVGVDVFEEAKKRLPPYRTGVPDEVSGAVCFLLSPAASFITGACVNVDCGGSLYAALYHHIEGERSFLVISTN